jgi:hypothetical protein
MPAPYDAYGDPQRAGGHARAADRFEPDRTLSQFDFGTADDPAAQRAIIVLPLVAIAMIGAIAAIAYFAGIIAAGIVTAAVGALVGFGNWILNNTIDLS